MFKRRHDSGVPGTCCGDGKIRERVSVWGAGSARSLGFGVQDLREGWLEVAAVGEDRELSAGFLDDGGIQVGEQEAGGAVELSEYLPER